MASVLDYISLAGLYADIDPQNDCWQDAAASTLAGIGDVVGNVPTQYDDPVIQSNATLKPQLQVDGLGWRNLYFDGVDDFLRSLTFQPPSSGAQPFEVTMVHDQSPTSFGVHVGDGGSGRFTKNSSFQYLSTFGANYVPAGTAENQVIVQYLVDGASSETWLNGVSAGAPGNAGSRACSTGLIIGNRSSLAVPANQNLWRLLIHEPLSSSNRMGLYTYLDNMYASAPPSGGSIIKKLPRRGISGYRGYGIT